MSFEEIVRNVIFLKHFGISHIRLTGGEPLLRKNLPKLIEMLVPRCKSLALTTNGTRLNVLANSLRLAGLDNINTHIDTLDTKKYKKLTGGDIKNVIEGLEAAKKAGIALKLNTVLLHGINDNEVPALLNFSSSIGAPIRFIELMPFCHPEFYKKHFIPANSILKDREMLPIDQELGHGPAEYYKDKETSAIAGLISPLTRKFCGQCDRLRLTSDGRLKKCLAKEDEINLAGCLLNRKRIEEHLHGKEYDHKNFLENNIYSLRSIGG